MRQDLDDRTSITVTADANFVITVQMERNKTLSDASCTLIEPEKSSNQVRQSCYLNGDESRLIDASTS
jgi:hypothetical protein